MAGWDDSIFSNLPGSPKRPKPPPSRGLMQDLLPVDPRQVIGGLYDQGAQGIGHTVDRLTGQPVGEGFSSPTLGRELYQMLTSPTFGGGASPMAGAGVLAAAPTVARVMKGARTAEEVATGVRAADAEAAAQRAAMASPGQAALDRMTQGRTNSFGYSSMADVPDIRRLPVNQAVQAAAGDPHLIVAGQGSPGYYIGAPAAVQSPADLAAIRAKLDAQIKAGLPGADWYERARAGEQRATGGDPAFNDMIAQAHGSWSQGVNPESETAFIIKEIASRLAGDPQRAMYENQHQAFLDAVAKGDPSLMLTGKKTGEYGLHINPNQPNPAGATGVNDFRMGQEMGFQNADATQRAGEFSLSPSQHTYMDYETAQAVARANAQNLGGRSNWTGPQIQAAPWVIQKAQALMDQRKNLSFEDAFAEANKTPQDFYDKHAVNATYEQQPAAVLAATGHTPQAGAMTPAQRIEYANDPRAAWASAPSMGLDAGELPRDVIYGQGRIGGSGLGLPTLPTQAGTGYFTNANKELENNPAFMARPLTPFNAATSLPGDIAKTIKDAKAPGPYAIFHGDQVMPLGQRSGTSDIAAALAKAKLDPTQPLDLTANLRDLGTWEGFDPSGKSTIAGTPAGEKVVPQYARDIFDSGELTRAYFGAQEGGAWHKNWPSGTQAGTTGYFTPLDRAATPEEMTRLSDAAKPFGMGDVTSSAGGITTTSFGDKAPPLSTAKTKQLQAALDAALPADAQKSYPVRTDSNYLPPQWGPVGAGTATDDLLARLNMRPELYDYFNQNPGIGRVAGGQALRDQAWAPVIGEQRPDIWNARMIAAANPEADASGWADRLAKYRKVGVPASVMVGGTAVSLYPTAGLPSTLPQGTTLNSDPEWQRQMFGF